MCRIIVSFEVSYLSFGTISMLAFYVWCFFNDCLHNYASEVIGSQVLFLIIEMVAFILWFRIICTIDVFVFMVWIRIIQMIAFTMLFRINGIIEVVAFMVWFRIACIILMIVFIVWFLIIGIIEMVFMVWSSIYRFCLPLWYLQTLFRLCHVVI